MPLCHRHQLQYLSAKRIETVAPSKGGFFEGGPRRYIMSLAYVFGQDQFLRCVANCAPIVFVVDNDISVRESLDLLIRFDGSLWTMTLRCQIENLAHGLEERGGLTSCSNG
jgi:hypothetical protein